MRGAHSLLTTPPGELHATTPDNAVRQRNWDYFRRLVDLCAGLGDSGSMILGSGGQLRTAGGCTAEDAVKRLSDGLALVADHAGKRGVTILPETLARRMCDVLTSKEQTRAVVDEYWESGASVYDLHLQFGCRAGL